MNGFLRGLLLAALSGIALAGCGGGGDDSNPPGASTPTAVVQPLEARGDPMRLRAATLSRISVEWGPART